MSEELFKINVKKAGLKNIEDCLEVDFEKDLDKSLEIEWLETNGLGGFASSTVVGANTRKQHGLLVAAMDPPVKRWVLLNKLEETIEINGKKTALSINVYPGVIHPQGNRFLVEFSKNPFPTFTYLVGDVEIKKTIFLLYHENTVAVVYEVKNAPKDSVMQINPFLSIRSFHDIISCDFQKFNVLQHSIEKAVVVSSKTENAPKLLLTSDKMSFSEKNDWYYDLVYQKERDRGYKFTEDNFCPGKFTVQLNEKKQKNKKTTRFFILAKAMQPNETVVDCKKELSFDLKKIDFLMNQEKKRRIDLVKTSRKQCKIRNYSFFDSLVLASDQFIVKRNSTSGSSIIAGYHWFADWGRDTMISLNGLALYTGRIEEAKQILLAFAKYHKKGVLPNRFLDATGNVEYN
ncbi:MAG: glycogen debranching enzyme family protein, partial [Candidatus Diapherotrites archaeon]|nr:glycogen debranching enzyme family protein [Candidatus Diapherotrites archaeon]